MLLRQVDGNKTQKTLCYRRFQIKYVREIVKEDKGV